MSDVGRKIAVVVGATALYVGSLHYAVSYFCTALPGPRVQMSLFAVESLFAPYLSAELTWAQLVHTLAVVLAAIPVAVLIRLFAGSDSFRISVLPSLLCLGFDPGVAVLPGLLCVPFEPGVAAYAPEIHQSTTTSVLLMADALKVVLAVPIVLWLLNKLPSNNALEQTRDG